MLALIERDETSYGDEVLRGWGKTFRTGLMLSDQATTASELDLIVTNVVVLWDPRLFGIKPELVIKGGFPAWGALGEGNASIPLSEPVRYGPHWGGTGVAAASISANFLSAAAAVEFGRRVPTRRQPLAVSGTRRVTKQHMLYKRANPTIAVDPGTAEVTIDGQPLPTLPVDDVPLSRRYLLL